MSVLSAILLPVFTDFKDKTYQKSNIANGHFLANALQAYYLDNDDYPSDTGSDYPIGYLLSSWDIYNSPKLADYLSGSFINPYTSSSYQSGFSISGAGDITLEIDADGGANGDDVVTITIYGSSSSQTLKTLILGDQVSGGGM